MAKAIKGYEVEGVPEDLRSTIDENPLFKVSKALSDYGFLNSDVIVRLESIDSLDKSRAEEEYNKFLSEIERIFDKHNDDTDEIYL